MNAGGIQRLGVGIVREPALQQLEHLVRRLAARAHDENIAELLLVLPVAAGERVERGLRRRAGAALLLARPRGGGREPEPQRLAVADARGVREGFQPVRALELVGDTLGGGEQPGAVAVGAARGHPPRPPARAAAALEGGARLRVGPPVELLERHGAGTGARTRRWISAAANRQPAASASGSLNSSGEWLTPPRLGTNSMSAGMPAP